MEGRTHADPYRQRSACRAGHRRACRTAGGGWSADRLVRGPGRQLRALPCACPGRGRRGHRHRRGPGVRGAGDLDGAGRPEARRRTVPGGHRVHARAPGGRGRHAPRLTTTLSGVRADLHARERVVVAGRTARYRPATSGDDPAMDLAIGFIAFTGPARRAFLDAYGPADDERLLRARTLAVHLSAALAEQAVGDGMADVTAESLAALGRTAHETPAAGSSPDVAGR